MRTLLALAVLLFGACSPPAPHAQPASQQSQPLDGGRPVSALPQELADGALRSATPDEIRAAIRRHGAHAVIRSLYGEQSDQGWNRVAAGIASGEQAWLDLVPPLRGQDAARAAAPSEELDIVVSDALPHNASGALRLIAADDEVDRVCSLRRIEPSDAEATTFYAAAIRAVEAVREPELQDLKRLCLASLHEAERTSQ